MLLEAVGAEMGRQPCRRNLAPGHRIIVSTVQQNALHGWRLRDTADMRMSGYPVQVKSTDWVGKLPYLASSGAGQSILFA